MEHRATNYDLEQRCINFAQAINQLLNQVPKTQQNTEYGKQVIRSSGSIGANYLEANASLGYKDFVLRIKIARKESKETKYWLHLLSIHESLRPEHQRLIQESLELIKILSTIVSRAEIKIVSQRTKATP